MEREVVIVGAGPAGATAAMALAELGHDVLMIDRQAFPRDKACGDGIPSGAFEIMYDFGMREKVEQAGFYPIERLRIVSPRGHIFEAPLGVGPKYGARSHVVPRIQFDALLQEHAISMGAEFCQARVEGPLMENGRVSGVQVRVNGSVKDIRAKIVLAADGVTSTIARAVRPDEHQDLHRAVALRAYIDDIETLPHQVEFHLYEGILPGYAWIFPLGEHQANIGLGMRLDKFRALKGNLKEMMKVFLNIPMVKGRLKHGGRLTGVTSWQLNFGSQRKLQRAFDGVMLIGDAGAFINPLTGGGIHNAMITAKLAAQTAHEAFRKGDFSRQTLQAYDEACHRELWRGMHRSFLIQRWAMRFPSLLDWVVKRAKSSGTFAQTFMTKL